MSFLKRLFRGKTEEKQASRELHGRITREQDRVVEAGRSETRAHMEAEVASDRERRGATDERPADSALLVPLLRAAPRTLRPPRF